MSPFAGFVICSNWYAYCFVAFLECLSKYVILIGDDVFIKVGAEPSGFIGTSKAVQNPLWSILFEDPSKAALCFIVFKFDRFFGNGKRSIKAPF